MDKAVVLNHAKWGYISMAIVWSIILFSAMGFLWYHRRLPQLQMRRLPLVFAAMISLHIYYLIVLVAYVLGSAYPCVVEYWVMSILLPLGIALFQIANTQFLWIAAQQRRYMSIASLEELKIDKKTSPLDGHTGSLWQRMRKRLQNLDSVTRMVIYVAVAMTVQVSISASQFVTNTDCQRLPSPSSSSYSLANSIRNSVFFQQISSAPTSSSGTNVFVVGSGQSFIITDGTYTANASEGGPPWYGNSSGRGSMPHPSCGHRGAFKTHKVGASKQYCAVSQVCLVRPSGLPVCTRLTSPGSTAISFLQCGSLCRSFSC